jgi:hypothetical protein
MNPNKIAAVILLAGLMLMFWSTPRAHSAEQREPFKWALVMQLPNKPAEARWLFSDKTGCELDLASSANAAPKGTRFQCQRRK